MNLTYLLNVQGNICFNVFMDLSMFYLKKKKKIECQNLIKTVIYFYF